MHKADELIVADPGARTVTSWTRDRAAYEEVAASMLLGATARWLRDDIGRP